MTGRRLAIVMLALLLSAIAFGATSGFAAEQAAECIQPGTEFGDAHCKGGVGAEWKKELFAENVATTYTMTNEKTAPGTTASTPIKLAGKLSGVEAEIECLKVKAEGSLKNQTVGGVKFVSASLLAEFSQCSVLRPAGDKCEVKGGGFETKPLTWTTNGQGANNVKIEPTTGTELFAVPFKSCLTAVLNHEWSAFGSWKVEHVSGATWPMEHAEVTAQATLKWDGNKAGFNGALTLNKKNEATTIALK